MTTSTMLNTAKATHAHQRTNGVPRRKTVLPSLPAFHGVATPLGWLEPYGTVPGGGPLSCCESWDDTGGTPVAQIQRTSGAIHARLSTVCRSSTLGDSASGRPHPGATPREASQASAASVSCSGLSVAPGTASGTSSLPSHMAVSAVAAISRTPYPIARSSTSKIAWWMSKSATDPGVLVPSLASAPGIESRYQAKSSPPRLCGAPVIAFEPSTRSAAASSIAVLIASLTVGGTLRW